MRVDLRRLRVALLGREADGTDVVVGREVDGVGQLEEGKVPVQVVCVVVRVADNPGNQEKCQLPDRIFTLRLKSYRHLEFIFSQNLGSK